jgi:D-alanyl-D-alanine carboxypeptidase
MHYRPTFPHVFIVLAASLALTGCGGAIAAQTEAAAPDKAVDAIVQRWMEQRHVAGLSLAVVRDGKVVLARGYGKANLELSVPATSGTVYQLGSVTKQFTAAAVMMLVREGKAALEDPIRKHLPELPEAWAGVTVRHLLNHTSGIRSYTSVPGFGKLSRKDFTKAELLALVTGEPVDFQPGEDWRYNNSGYFLLGMLVEKLSGKSYGEFLTERIFKPLEMRSTRVNDLSEVVPRRATGYRWEGSRWRNGEYVSPTQPFSAGALLSTVEDLARWDAALYSDQVLPKDLLQQSWTATKLNGGREVPYGFGWSIGTHQGHRFVEHGGDIPGFASYLARFPDDRLTVVVLTNTDAGVRPPLTREIAGVYVPALKPEPPKAAEDRDPKTTEAHRKLLAAFLAGEADDALFSEDARKAGLPARIREQAPRLKELGAIKSFSLVERNLEKEPQVHRYRVVTEGATLLATFALGKDGKVVGVILAPAE